MGYSNVLNVGGIGDWEKNGGPMSKWLFNYQIIIWWIND
jgi:hypothetical protein